MPQWPECKAWRVMAEGLDRKGRLDIHIIMAANGALVQLTD